MKKSLKLTAAFLAILFVSFSFSSCGVQKIKKYDFSSSSIASSATFTGKSGNSAKASLKGTDGDYIDIAFPEETTVDTVVLYENGENITEYEIFAEIDGELKSIYRQDKVGSFRYCAFPDTVTSKIRVQVNSAKDGKFNIKKIDVLNTKTSRDDFRIASYVIADRVYDETKLDKSHFSVITDAILFGAVTFDETGELKFAEYEIDGQKINALDVLIKDIENLRAVEGETPLKIYINILGPSDDDTKVKEQKHTDTFKNYGDKLNQNIISLLAELNVDGVYFDYEYPYTGKGWTAYSDYLVSLKSALGEKYKLGIALGAWGKTLNDKAKQVVDYIEVMAYDMFDDDGYHASFASTGGALALDYTNKKGYDLKKCDLGVPFYSRPINKDARWDDYSSAYESLGKYGNLDTSAIEVDGETVYNIPRYFNSYQMIFDKTAFSYDYGAAGMMIWHYSCDVPDSTGLSLFSAMNEAVNSRKA